jgi:hypothetical protein
MPLSKDERSLGFLFLPISLMFGELFAHFDHSLDHSLIRAAAQSSV